MKIAAKCINAFSSPHNIVHVGFDTTSAFDGAESLHPDRSGHVALTAEIVTMDFPSAAYTKPGSRKQDPAASVVLLGCSFIIHTDPSPSRIHGSKTHVYLYNVSDGFAGITPGIICAKLPYPFTSNSLAILKLHFLHILRPVNWEPIDPQPEIAPKKPCTGPAELR